jgi:hypothetical protein
MVEDPDTRPQGTHHIRSPFVPTRSAFVGKSGFPLRQPSHRGSAVAYVYESRRPRLLDQVREAIRTRHYSLRTEEAYIR